MNVPNLPEFEVLARLSSQSAVVITLFFLTPPRRELGGRLHVPWLDKGTLINGLVHGTELMHVRGLEETGIHGSERWWLRREMRRGEWYGTCTWIPRGYEYS